MLSRRQLYALCVLASSALACGKPARPDGDGGNYYREAGDLPCLKALFAQCPTSGSCRAAGDLRDGPATACYDTGASVGLDAVENSCATATRGTQISRIRVSKPDGSLCYTYEWSCICQYFCEWGQAVWRDASGTIVATQSSSSTNTIQCASGGETCPNDPDADNPDQSQRSSCRIASPLDGCTEGSCP